MEQYSKCLNRIARERISQVFRQFKIPIYIYTDIIDNNIVRQMYVRVIEKLKAKQQYSNIIRKQELKKALNDYFYVPKMYQCKVIQEMQGMNLIEIKNRQLIILK